MQIFHSKTSPFARKVAMVLHITGFISETDFHLIDPFKHQHLRNTNPLGKVPVLIDEDITLFDSTLICEYLDDRHVSAGGASLYRKGKDDYYPVQKLHTLANGILDAAVAIVMETRRETQASDYWLERWRETVETGMAMFEREVSLEHSPLATNAPISMASITLICVLGYLDFRLPHYLWRQKNQHLAKWRQRLADELWVTATAPPAQA